MFRFRPLGLIVVLALLVAACDTAPGPSLYDPIEDGSYQAPRANPTLASISPPPGEALAGVSVLTLTGQNFVPNADSTFVYFNGTRYPVLSVTPTEIRMRAPNLPQDGLRVRVAVLRAEHFSETHTYRLLPALERLGAQGPAVSLSGLTSDEAGDAYVSYLEDGRAFIRKVTADGIEMPFGTSAPSSATYPGLAFTPTNGLLGVRQNRAVYRIAEGGTASGSAFVDLRTTALLLRAIDLDDEGNIWTGGRGTNTIYRIAPDQSVIEVSHPAGNVLAIEEHAGYVYFSLSQTPPNVSNRIYRFSVNGNTTGPVEEVVDIIAAYPSVYVNSLAFAANGDLFMGTAFHTPSPNPEVVNQTPILELPAGGMLGELYDGLMTGDVVGLAWGNGTILYAAGPKIVGVTTSESTGGDLIKINTLREGSR